MHAGADGIEMLDRQPLVEMSRIIVRHRLSEFGYAALVGVECLAGVQRGDRSVADELRSRAVAFADPERDQAFAVAGIVEDFDNAAFRRESGLRAKAFEEGHAVGLRTCCLPIAENPGEIS